MNNKALMGVCAVILVAILAGTYLWMDVDNDDGTITWHATHVEYIYPDGTVGMIDIGVEEEFLPMVIHQYDENKFIIENYSFPVIGIIDHGFIMYEYQYRYLSKTYNVYAEGTAYDTYMNIVEICTDFDTGEIDLITFTQYTRDGKPAVSMEGNYFDFDMPFTPIDCMHYQDGTATSVPTSSFVLKSQQGMIATFEMEVLGVTNEFTLIGTGYYDNGGYSAIGYGCINGDYEYCNVDIDDGIARFLFTCTSATGEAYYISSTYEVPYQEGEHLDAEDISGSWIGSLSTLYTDGSTVNRDVHKVIEKVDDHYYTCTEETTDNGTFTWDMFVDGDFIDVRVFRTIDGTTEEIGYLVGNSYEGSLYLEGIQYRSGYVDGYAVTFYMSIEE